MNKKTGLIIALAVTAIHLFRFNLPEQICSMYYFTLFGFVAWAIAFIALFFYTSNRFIKCVYLFNFIGVCNATQNMLRGSPDPGLLPEGIMLAIALITCIVYFKVSKEKRFRTNRK